MKKYFFLNTVFVLITLSLYSQEVQLSRNYEIVKGESYERITHFYKKYYSWKNKSYILSKTKDGFVIQQIDPTTLKELSKTEIKKVISKKKDFFNNIKEKVEQIIQFNDKIFVFVSTRIKKNEVLEVFSISLTDFIVSNRKRIISTPNKLVKAEDRNEYQVKSKFNFKEFDSNTLMIDYVERNKKTDQWNFVFNVFDYEINSIKSSNVKINNSKSIVVVDRLIDSKDNYYFLGQEFKPSVLQNGAPDNQELVLYQISRNGEDHKKSHIKLEEQKVIEEAKLHLTKDNNLNVIGTLRNHEAKDGLLFGKRKGEPTGIFVLNLNDDLQSLDLNYHKFPIKMLEKNLSKKETRKVKKKDKSKGFDSYFKGLKILINENDNRNETVIIGEQQFSTIERVKKIDFERFHFNSILATKILPDGSIKWMHKLIKFQRGRYGKGDMSFNSLNYKNKHYIFFRDNEKNFGVEQEDISYVYPYGRGGYLASYIVDDTTGNVEKEAVFYPKGRSSFNFLANISENELIYEQILENKENRLVKISINP